MMNLLTLLTLIYQHQTLNLQQLLFLYPSFKGREREFMGYLKAQEKEGLLEKIPNHPQNPNYCVTNQGVQYIRQNLDPAKPEEAILKRILFTEYQQASRIKPSQKQLDRQNRLNDFEAIVRKNTQQLNMGGYHYIDRRFYPKTYTFTNSQGMFELYGHRFFIHVEGREYTATGLTKLFEQAYLKKLKEIQENQDTRDLSSVISEEFTVLVIGKTEDSTRQWEKSLYPVMTQLVNQHVNLVVGTQQEVIRYLFNTFIPQTKGQWGFKKQVEAQLERLDCTLTPQNFADQDLTGVYQGVIRSNQTHRSILYTYHDTTTKAATYTYLNHMLNYQQLQEAGYPATLLVIVPDAEKFSQEILNLSTCEDIDHTPLSYITTLDALAQSDTLEEAILQRGYRGWIKGVLPPHFN